MTAADRTGFARDLLDLQAHYLHHRLRREPWWGMDYAFGNFTLLKAVCKNAPGVRMDLDDIPWRQMLAAAWAAFEQHRAPEERNGFAAMIRQQWIDRWLAGFPIFEQHQLERHFFGCFCYDFHPERAIVQLHFHNLETPQSPLADPAKRRADLQAIVRDVEQQGHAPQLVGFESWMNALAPVAALFPESFAKSLKAAEEFPKGYGWWGQFVTKDGQINPKRAAMLKNTGRFEFARLNGVCPWADFRAKVLP